MVFRMSDRDVTEAWTPWSRCSRGRVWNRRPVAAWQASFDQALGNATRGPGWPGIAARAHHWRAVSVAGTQALVEQRDRLRTELNLQGQGARALKGYRST